MKRLVGTMSQPASALAGSLTVERLIGADVHMLVSAEIDDLAMRCSAPATASGPWLAGTLAGVPERRAWAVVVRDSARLLRAAVVVFEDVDPAARGTDCITLVGSAMGQRSAVLADSVATASLLGHAFSEVLNDRVRPARVQLGPVDTGAAGLADFVAMIGGAEIVASDPIPGILRLDSADVADYLSPAMRRTLRKAENRAATDEKQLVPSITGDEFEIAELLPQLEQLHRERDHAQGRRSELDDTVGRRIWRSRLRSLARHHALELATLHIDGELAAHVLAIAELTEYRIVEGVLATRFARYAPGRVLEAAVLQRVLDDPIMEHLDWMTAVASERLLAANDAQPVSYVRVDLPGGRR